jgi:hypothetical protein
MVDARIRLRQDAVTRESNPRPTEFHSEDRNRRSEFAVARVLQQHVAIGHGDMNDRYNAWLVDP